VFGRVTLPKRLLAVIAVVLASSVAAACNIPVFRYALERWTPDDYEAVVFCDGELTQTQSQVFERLASEATINGGATNFTVKRFNVGDDVPLEFASLFKSLQKSTDKPLTLPYLVIRSISQHGTSVNVWSSPLDNEAVDRVIDSPARKELAKRLLRGDSVVWLLIRSKDEKLNQQARDILERSFRTIQTKMMLPEGIGLPGSELYSDVPLLIQFSTLEVSNDDPQESLLVKLLARGSDASDVRDEPVLVPVFGRGRALEVMPLSDLSTQLVEDLTLFLGGACSCQVKEQNPGFDLLLNVDWNGELYGDDGLVPPPSSGNGNPEKRPVLLTIPSGKKK
jgi:hypothetical protein